MIDWCKFEVRDESDDGLVLFIQIMRDINFSMITKKNWNLKYEISKFKDGYWGNTKSKKYPKKGQVGWGKVLQWKVFHHKVDIDIKR